MLAVEVGDHEDRGQDAREQRAESGALGAHLRETEVAVDEDPVEADVGQVGDDRDDHLDLRVAHALEELLEGEEEHDEGHAQDKHPVVGDGHVDDVDRLPHLVEQRDGGVLQRADGEAQHREEEDAVLKQRGRAAPVSLRVELPDEGREAEGHADRGDEEDEEDRSAERYGGQRRGVVASVTADHDVVGDLYEDLPQLGHHDGQGQFQIGFVLLFVG